MTVCVGVAAVCESREECYSPTRDQFVGASWIAPAAGRVLPWVGAALEDVRVVWPLDASASWIQDTATGRRAARQRAVQAAVGTPALLKIRITHVPAVGGACVGAAVQLTGRLADAVVDSPHPPDRCRHGGSGCLA